MPKDPMQYNPFGDWIPEMLDNVEKQQQTQKPAPLVPEVVPAAAAPVVPEVVAPVVPEVVAPIVPEVAAVVPPVVDPKLVDPKAVAPVVPEEKPDASATGVSTGTDTKVTNSGNPVVPAATK